MVQLKDKVLLIAEDDVWLQDAYHDMFIKLFKNVIVVSGGNAAIEVLKTTEIDLIISDVNMPDGDGADIIDYLISCPIHPPLIVVTAHSELTGLCNSNHCIICKEKPVSMPDMIKDMIKLVEKDNARCGTLKAINAIESFRDRAKELLIKINNKDLLDG